MDTNVVTLVGVFASLLLGLSSILWQWYRERHPSKGEEESTSKIDIDASASAASAIKQYSDEILRLRDELKTLKDQVRVLEDGRSDDRRIIYEWQNGIRRLIAQFESMNVVPVWKPSDLETTIRRP
jgi:hypothetical protein